MLHFTRTVLYFDKILVHTVNTQGEAIVSFVMDNYQTSRDEYAAEPI